MQRARLPLVIVGSAALVLGLTACEKPNPGATVFSGTSSAYQQALCWAPEGQYLDEKSCASDVLDAGGSKQSISVTPGQTIGISVDPVVAEKGWFPAIGGQRITAAPVTQTYFRFTPTAEQLATAQTPLWIVAGDDKGTSGIWVYQLTQ